MLKSAVGPDRRPAPARRAAGRISPAGGTAEREADSAARSVMRGRGSCACGGGCPRCGATPDRGSAGGTGRGRPLESATRSFFEPRFGRDLGAVRVHDDDMAARSARALGAKAYTVGADIVFARGRYAPERSEGQALLAHELAHVVLHAEQAPGTIFRSEEETPPPDAEIERLYGEMMSLAIDNTWSGVNRNYMAIKEMGPDAFDRARDPVNLHFLGAEASRGLGDRVEQRNRLRRALAALGGKTGDEADQWRTKIEEGLGAIESGFGMVSIRPRTPAKSEKKAAKRGGPTLVAAVPPFVPDLRKSIEAAAATLAEKGEFSGMLPAGQYLLDDVSITVVAGTDNSFLWGD